MKKSLTLLFSVIFLLSLAFSLGCTTSQPADNTDTINMVVTIQPQLEFAEKVSGDKVTVNVMVPAGASPHTYEPLPSQITNLANADIYAQVGSGIEFEIAWMDKLESTNNKMLVVNCSDGIQLIASDGNEEEHATEHEEDNEGHHHGAMDPHIWTSPANAIIMAENIKKGLQAVDQANSDYYEDNFQAYKQQLSALDSDIRNSLKTVDNKAFMTYHPAYGYFAHEYGLEMIAIQEEGKEPSAAALAELIETAKKNDIKAIFISPQFNPESAQTIASEIGCQTIEVDVLATDYLENMRYFANELLNSLQ
jgi:zinc transport system substrate-binding protein